MANFDQDDQRSRERIDSGGPQEQVPDGAVPLSTTQYEIWFAQQLSPANPISIAQYVDLVGEIDIELLAEAIVIAGHEFQSPFTRLIEIDNQPFQVVDHSIDDSVHLVDFRDDEDPEAAAHEWMLRDHIAPLNLLADPLASSSILRVGESHHLWYSRIHHIVLDGYGAMVMLNRIAALYSAAVEGRQADVNTAVGVRALYDASLRYRSSNRFTSDREYWAKRCNPVPDFAAPVAPVEPNASRTIRVSAPLSRAVDARLTNSRDLLGASEAAVLLASAVCYLSRITGQQEVVVSFPVSARTTAALRRSGGMLANVVPLQLTLHPGDTVGTLITRVTHELVGALRHQGCTMGDIRRGAGLADAARRFSGPIVNLMLFHQQTRFGSVDGKLNILALGPVDDLTITVYRSGVQAKTIIDFRANAHCYREQELRVHHQRFLELLEEFLGSHPTAEIRSIHPDSARTGANLRRNNAQMGYWRRVLSGAPDVLTLPLDRPRPVRRSFRAGVVRFSIGARCHRVLRGVARQSQVTMFMVVHAALSVLLARLSGTEDIAVGTPVSGRGAAAVDGVVGMFVNTLVLRTRVQPARSFAELLECTRAVDLGAFDHADVPFERVVAELVPSRSTQYSPLFQVLLEFRSSEYPCVELPDLAVERVDVDPGVARFDLQLTLAEEFDEGGAPAGIGAGFTFAADLFDSVTIHMFADRLVRILTAVAADPSTPVGDIAILNDHEHQQLTPVRRRREGSRRTLPQILAIAAALNPGAAALSFHGTELSYRELDERSNRLARLLIAKGVGPERCVAVSVARSVESVTSVWAIAKTGAAFLPVDSTYPLERTRHMLTDSGSSIGLTVRSERQGLPEIVDWLVLDTPDAGQGCAEYSAAAVTDLDRISPLSQDNVAYTIYTSGSTGPPKAVVVTHGGLASLCDEQIARYGLTSQSRTLHFASPSFDAAVLELLLAFGAGGTMVIAPTTISGGAALAQLLEGERVTHAFVTPTALATVDPAGLDALRVLVVGGERCGPGLLTRWAAGRKFFNGYGPTEATIMTNISDPLVAGGPVNVGGPVPGVHEVVLDVRLGPVPVGVAGELYLAGAGLARGYLACPGLTAARFVADPYGAPGERMYRTGDMVRWSASLAIECLGRSDSQVKLRGFRIELGEVEAALLRHEGVLQAVVELRDDGMGDRLVGYVVPTAGTLIDTTALRRFVGSVLPAHMVPANLVVLDALPMTPVGKVDRRALPAPELWTKTPLREAMSPVEEILAGVFAEVLGVERVGVDDDFFELGGDSLSATRVAARMTSALGTAIGVRDLFEAPSVGRLAALVRDDAGGAPTPALVRRERPSRVPLSLAQQRMWVINQFDTTSPAYNIAIAMRLIGNLDISALRAAMVDVLDRQEALRTVFPDTDDGPVQAIVSAERAMPDLTLASVEDETQIRQRLDRFGAAGFDVAAEVPVRAQLFRTGPKEHVLMIVIHHIAADGFSMTPLARDVTVAYEARYRSQAPDWAPLPVQYTDYTLWQREWLGDEENPRSQISKQLGYWRRVLSGVPDVLTLPLDRPRPVRRSFRAGVVRFSIGARCHRVLRGVARQSQVTMFMIVHAALSVLLARLSGTEDIAVGTPVSGRGAAAVDGVVGMFVNTLVLRTRVQPARSFAELLECTRAVDLGAFDHADVPFERVVAELVPSRSTQYSPLFQVLLEFRSSEYPCVELPDLAVERVDVDPGVARFDLQLTLAEEFDEGGAPAGIGAGFTFAADVFDSVTIHMFADRLVRILTVVAADPSTPVGRLD